MIIDKEIQNSSGYFADPVTRQPLTGLEERVVTCGPGEAWVWPMIKASNGQNIKIVYKLFTDDEKTAYKEYRARGTSYLGDKPVKQKAAADEHTAECYDRPEDITHDPKSACSLSTRELIDYCDGYLGVNQIAGLTYALLIKSGSNKIYHVPRALITNKDMERLCG